MGVFSKSSTGGLAKPGYPNQDYTTSGGPSALLNCRLAYLKPRLPAWWGIPLLGSSLAMPDKPDRTWWSITTRQ